MDSNLTSTGHHLAGSAFLDAHYGAAREKYESMLRSVGIGQGWRVLDAGCGGGNFLPLLAELVGPQGTLSALDLAPENVERVGRRVAEGEIGCGVEARVGAVTVLPYPDESFDAVWNANVSQYLADDEFRAALAEFRRVVRPGGLVAVKEDDLLLEQVFPAPPHFYAHMLEAASATGDLQTRGMLRPLGFPRWFRSAGLEVVRSRSEVIEFRAPLRPVEREYVSAVLQDLAALASQLPLREAELAIWQRLHETRSPHPLLDDPDFCWREGQVMVVGRKM